MELNWNIKSIVVNIKALFIIRDLERLIEVYELQGKIVNQYKYETVWWIVAKITQRFGIHFTI